MKKETKINILQSVVNAGIKGTTREMLDNLTAMIKSYETYEGTVVKVLPKNNDVISTIKLPNVKVDEVTKPVTARKAGRPPKQR
jgi:hypothetical protein